MEAIGLASGQLASNKFHVSPVDQVLLQLSGSGLWVWVKAARVPNLSSHTVDRLELKIPVCQKKENLIFRADVNFLCQCHCHTRP